MKKFICLLIACLSLHCLQAQITVTKTRISDGNVNDYLHKVANEFSQEVDNKLKVLYPAKVKNITVKLDTINDLLRLIYTAQIAQCCELEAQYYFDHRGTLSTGEGIMDTYADASMRTKQQKQDALEEFKQAYGNVVVVSENSSTVKYYRYRWFICEVFIASRKL